GTGYWARRDPLPWLFGGRPRPGVQWPKRFRRGSAACGGADRRANGVLASQLLFDRGPVGSVPRVVDEERRGAVQASLEGRPRVGREGVCEFWVAPRGRPFDQV